MKKENFLFAFLIHISNYKWMKQGILLVFFGAIFMNCSKPEKQRDIYLCIGQSNMAGRAAMGDVAKDTLERVYLFKGNEEFSWEKAANPLNKYSSIRKNMKMQKVGPAYSFSQNMAASFPDREIGLVVNAKGGTSIRLWHPDSLFFKEAVRRTKIAMQDGELKGIIWHQGCSDASAWKSYLPKLTLMVSQLRKEFDLEKLPFVAGQLSFDKKHRASFNEMILRAPDQIPFSAVVSSEGLHTIDSTHFDTESQLELGKRYAEKMLQLMKDENE